MRTKNRSGSHIIILPALAITSALEGRLQQIRIPLTKQPSNYNGAKKPPPFERKMKHARPYFDRYGRTEYWCWWDQYDRQGPDWIRIPYQYGDLLIVREGYTMIGQNVVYRSGHPESRASGPRTDIKWKAPIMMPRELSRLKFCVKSVRVNRVQDITEKEALTEGIIRYEPTETDPAEFAAVPGGTVHLNPMDAYRDLVRHTLGPKAWIQNPWMTTMEIGVRQSNPEDEQPADRQVA